MWKHVIIAASFESGWAINNPVTGAAVTEPTVVAPDMGGVANMILLLTSGFAGVPVAIGTSGLGTAEPTRDGVEGTFDVTCADPAGFIAADTSKNQIEEWMATIVNLPQASVVVTMLPAPTPVPALATTAAPATLPSTGPAASEDLEDDSAPDTPLVLPGVVHMTYALSLPPGQAEISDRLRSQPPANILEALNTRFPPAISGGAPTVTAAQVALEATTTTTGVSGHLTLGLTDMAAFEANGDSLRTVIAALANVYLGDVGAVTFGAVTATGTIPPPPENQPDVGPQVEGRRLTAGALNANFVIQVPGHAALGWQKDCSLQKVTAGARTFAAVDAITNPTPGVATAAACGESASTCISSGCTVWTWDSAASSCTFGDADTLQFAVGPDRWSATAITQRTEGSDSCGACPTAAPVTAWPAATAALSHSAFGVFQPLNLQCWPKNAAFDLMPCGYQVLEDHANLARPWTGRCNNLVVAEDTAAQVDCQNICIGDPFCTVWMWATAEGQTSTDADVTHACYTGAGNDCFTPSMTNSVGEVIAAQRIQHGQVHVIVEDFITNIVEGLQNQFWESVGQDADGVGGPDTALISLELQRDACRNICHSNIMCNYWQSFYNDGTTDNLGCWTENPGVNSANSAVQSGGAVGGFVSYPLTQADLRVVAVDEVTHLTGGQFIQHHCDIPTLPTRPLATFTTTTTLVQSALPVVTTVPESGSFMYPWGWLLIAAALIAAVAGVSLYVMGSKAPKPKAKSTRAVKPIKAKEVPAPPAPPPQPVVPLMAQQLVIQPTIPQPLAMSMIASPVTTFAQAQAVAQPMATYAGAPQYVGAPQQYVRPY